MTLLRLLLCCSLCFTLCACATTGYHKPEKPPVLGVDGWPVGIWENEQGNRIQLREDGTGTWTHKETWTVNTHLIWSYQNNQLRIDRWIVNAEEANYIDMHGVPLKMIEEKSQIELRRLYKGKQIIKSNTSRQIRNYLATVQDSDWWIFNNVTANSDRLNGTFYRHENYFSWDGNGDITGIRDQGVKAISTSYILVEKTSRQYLSKLEREQQRLQDQSLAQAGKMAQRIQDAANQNSHKRLAVLDLNAKADRWAWFTFSALFGNLEKGKQCSLVEMSLIKDTLVELKIDASDLVASKTAGVSQTKADKPIQQIMELTGADAVIIIKFADQNNVQVSYLSKEANQQWSFNNAN